MSIQCNPKYDKLINEKLSNNPMFESIMTSSIILTNIEFLGNPHVDGFGYLSKHRGTVIKTDENETFKLDDILYFHSDSSGEYIYLTVDVLFREQSELIEWAKNGGKLKVETTKKPNKIDNNSDAGFMGVVDIVSFLYKNSASQTKYHLIRVTKSMMTRRKIDELCSKPVDKKEINRYYQAKSYFKRLVKEKKIEKKNSGGMNLNDYEGLYKVAAERYHLTAANLKSVIQAEKRGIQTAETMLKSAL